MKTILIITNETKTIPALSEAREEWQKEYNVLIAGNEQEASKVFENEDIDFLVCDYFSRPEAQLRPLTQLILEHPYVPCITIINPDKQVAEDFLGIGVSVCFEVPFQVDELYRWATKLIDLSSSGEIRGLPTHSILQMLESEKKACTLKVQTNKDVGYIYLERGEVHAAEYGDLIGEEAAYTLIADPCESAEIKFYNLQKERDINKSVMSLIMESFRIKDEKESLAAREGSQDKTRKELKHFFTIDSPLQIDQGLNLRLELEDDSPSMAGNLIGISKNNYIIVNRPSELEGPITASKDMRIVVKYLQSGRVCMFKANVIKQLSQPEPLLFLEYPMVVHYHELRQSQRADIYVPCIMTLASGPRHSSALLDLSETGCLCQIKTDKDKLLPQIDPSGAVSLFCLFPGVGEEQEIQGVIRNVKRKSTELRVGIEFTELSEDLRKIIGNYLDSLL